MGVRINISKGIKHEIARSMKEMTNTLKNKSWVGGSVG